MFEWNDIVFISLNPLEIVIHNKKVRKRSKNED